MDLVEQVAFFLDRRRAPANVEPHQAERPVQEALCVGRVSPPRRDVGRDAGIGDRRLEPRVVAWTEHRCDCTVEGVCGGAGDPDLWALVAGGPTGTGPYQRLA